MLVFNTIKEIRHFLSPKRGSGKSIGFVPTMGALHEGHLTLIRQAARENDTVVSSIFVNPIQFNNPEDLKKYPRTLEADISLLEQSGCKVLFHPSEKEMYPEPATEVFNFGALEHIMEGLHRPGHFQGVAVVVKRLFTIVEPDRAYFGMKDYQQLMVVKEMVRQTGIHTEIISCPTIREADGLAMSSRNRRLSQELRLKAPVIYRTLSAIVGKKNMMPLPDAERWAIEQIEAVKPFKVEYLEISDAQSLKPAAGWEDFPSLVACTAVWAEDVRLIDNVLFL